MTSQARVLEHKTEVGGDGKSVLYLMLEVTGLLLLIFAVTEGALGAKARDRAGLRRQEWATT